MRDYSYDLPDNRIAEFPLTPRDSAKLLIWRAGVTTHARFAQLADFLDSSSILFFNDTRVIPARIHFKKDTGAQIEVLLMAPVTPPLTQPIMSSKGNCQWRCLIGNLKRWSERVTLTLQVKAVTLHAVLVDRDKGIVQFEWTPEITFAEVLEKIGDTPLPPYIHRSTTDEDRGRYQTVYARHKGAVAAPTAGLHFTDDVIRSLTEKNIQTDFLTLHVSAGTFLPVKTEDALAHRMHEEQIVVTRTNILNLLSGKKVVAVGTTSMRTLESLYWFGCLLAADPEAPFEIPQDIPYLPHIIKLSVYDSLQNVLQRMSQRETIQGRTSIFIRPGYTFQVCDSLITNFHQPGSTLLLLVAAFAGPGWKSIYEEALKKGYRFLSYGDSSLIEANKT
jgi:S-adenosylmethionine:tRNA ribosyltransferase-isomerase